MSENPQGAKGPRTAGLYVRYSTEEQRLQSFSEEMQTDQCRKRLREVYGDVPCQLRVFRDLGKSGAIGLDDPVFGGKEHRDGLEAMLRAMADGELDLVLCYSQDRLARDEFLWHFMNATIFQKYRIPILFAREGHDVLTEEGQMVATLHALSASLERRKASRNVTAACQRRAAEGYFGGAPPYGWRFDPTQEMGPRVRRRIVRDEGQGAIVLEVKERYMCGWPTAAIARDLHHRGICSPSGGLRWSTCCLLQVMRNPVHAGLVRYKDQLHLGQHLPLRYWTPEERELILQRMVERRSRLLHARHVENYLLAGLLFCEHCGRRLLGHRDARRSQRFYSCRRRDLGGEPRQLVDGQLVAARSCPQMGRDANELEAAVIGVVADLARSDQIQSLAQQRLQEAIDVKDERLKMELEAVAKDLHRVQQGFSRLFALLDEGRIRQEEFDAENERRRTEQEALEARRDQLQVELSQRQGRLVRLQRALELLRDFDNLWDKMTAGERKELLRQIDPHMTLRREPGQLVLTIRPGWAEPIERVLVMNPRQRQWTPSPDAPLTPAQLAMLCLWDDGLSIREIAQARDIGTAWAQGLARETCQRLGVANLDDAVELVRPRLERCRPTLKITGRFNRRPAKDPAVLSDPLLAVLRLMAAGKRCTDIALELGKDKSTVSRQMLQINRRLAVCSREEAIARATELGLI